MFDCKTVPDDYQKLRLVQIVNTKETYKLTAGRIGYHSKWESSKSFMPKLTSTKCCSSLFDYV